MPRFCTALHEGHRCGYRARPGRAFCYGHDPHRYDYQPCQYFNQRGQQCRNMALRGQDHCHAHSPRYCRAELGALPVNPRTRRQRERVKWLLISNMPPFRSHPKEPPPIQQFATGQVDRGGTPAQPGNVT